MHLPARGGFHTSPYSDYTIAPECPGCRVDAVVAWVVAATPTTGLRFFTVYGPWGRPDMALFKFTRAILADEPITVFNHGNHNRDFTYIDDIVEGVVRASDTIARAKPDWDGDHPDPATSRAPFRIYNIGNSTPVRLNDYITALERQLGRTAKRELLPMQVGDVPDTHADIGDLVEQLGYRPRISVEEGIRRFTDWYLDYYGASKA
jgi:UDP-glucuronate 4-epimerase